MTNERSETESNSFRDILKLHAAAYPEMLPRDACKLTYQHVFGGGHMIKDAALSLKRLTDELSETSPRDVPAFTDIGNMSVRMDLSSPSIRALPAELLNKMFIASANRPHGDANELARDLLALEELARHGEMPFSSDELASFLSEYREKGCPAISHSEKYRRLYSPSYRVINVGYARLAPVLPTIAALKKPCVISIDGMCASGKTVLAELLCEILGASVVHMDDFFLPPELRTPERLTEAGGNVHYERFMEEVAPFLGRGESFSYNIFDCSIMRLNGKRLVEPRDITIVEGTYSSHPAFGNIYDLRILSVTDAATQQSRLLKRDGEEMLRRFNSAWIPMESRYFEMLGKTPSISFVRI